jgi:hypothetical protein
MINERASSSSPLHPPTKNKKRKSHQVEHYRNAYVFNDGGLQLTKNNVSALLFADFSPRWIVN